MVIQTEMTAIQIFVLIATSLPQSQPAHLWHCKYGHLGHKGLRTLQYKKMVHGILQFKALISVCTDCMIGKQHQDLIPKKNNWRAIKKLQLAHADICGPISPTSNSKKKYFISFIDDFTREIWI